MLRTVRDKRADPAMRLEAARAAAPYCHPRLSSIDVSNHEDGNLIIEIVQFKKEDLIADRAQPLLPYSVTEALPVSSN